MFLISGDFSTLDFLIALFRVLEEHDVRYCVLHTWKDLPEVLSSDLDVAVHPHDRTKLVAAFATLRSLGFTLVQCQHYAVHGYAFFFGWLRGSELQSVQLDVTFEYCPSGAVSLAGRELVAGRRRHKSFWIADPAVAFRYLLIKKSIKGAVSDCQQEQLGGLVEEIGRPAAETVAAELFGNKWKKCVVDACSSGTLASMAKRLAGRLRRRSIVRDPAGVIRHLISDSLRLAGRWLRPTGVCVVLLGPDGVGKSALARSLTDALEPIFSRRRGFHFRPQLIAPQKLMGPPAVGPHCDKRRGSIGSVGRLLVFFLDCWVGYLVSIRPFVSRSGLVLFDRSFHDLTIDSQRYRYGGPRWLPRLLARWVPPFNPILLVLDAEISVILSRKREIASEELSRLRTLYNDFASKTPCAFLVNTDAGIERSRAVSLVAIFVCLSQRFELRHRSWFVRANSVKHEDKVEDVPI